MGTQEKGPRRWTLDELRDDPLIDGIKVLEPVEGLFKSKGRWQKNVAHPGEVKHWSPIIDVAEALEVSRHKLYRYFNRDCIPGLRIAKCGYAPKFDRLIPFDPALIKLAEAKADERAWRYTQRMCHTDADYRKPKPPGNWCSTRRRPGKRGQR